MRASLASRKATRRARLDAAKARYLQKMRQRTVYLSLPNHDFVASLGEQYDASFVAALNRVVDAARRAHSRKAVL